MPVLLAGGGDPVAEQLGRAEHHAPVHVLVTEQRLARPDALAQPPLERQAVPRAAHQRHRRVAVAIDEAGHEQAAELAHLGPRRGRDLPRVADPRDEPVFDLHRSRQEHGVPGVDGEDGVGHQAQRHGAPTNRRPERSRETRIASGAPSTVTSTVPSGSRPPTLATTPGMKPPSSSRVSEPRFSSTSSLIRNRRTRSPSPASARGLVGHPGQRRARSGDRIAVRAGRRVAEQLDQPGLDVVGDHVLPAARLPVHLGPLEPDDVDEQPLGQAVLAHDLLRQGPPAVGEEQPPSFPGHVPVLGEPVQHLGHGRGGAAQALGDAGLNHRDALLAEREHGLEVLLDGRVVLLRRVGAVLSHGSGPRPRTGARRGRGCGRRTRPGRARSPCTRPA